MIGRGWFFRDEAAAADERHRYQRSSLDLHFHLSRSGSNGER